MRRIELFCNIQQKIVKKIAFLKDKYNVGLYRKYFRCGLITLAKVTLVFFYKIIGPPRILKYPSSVNVAILRAFGANVSKKAIICSPITLHNSGGNYSNLTINEKCNLSGNNFLDLRGRITLEKGVSLGPCVIIMTHNRYNFNSILEERMSHTCGIKDVLIKEGSGIKAGALIVHGITVGKNSIVGGNAVVNRDVPDNCFFAGVPARLIKHIE